MGRFESLYPLGIFVAMNWKFWRPDFRLAILRSAKPEAVNLILGQQEREQPKVPGLGKPWWQDFYALLEDPDSDSVLRPTTLLSPIALVPRKPETATGLIAASRFAISRGLFSLGGALRLAGRDILLECLSAGHLRRNPALLIPAMSALVEVGEWDAFIGALLNLPEKLDAKRRGLATLLATAGPTSLRRAHPLLNDLLPQDPLFAEYVADKRVAVVGPAASTAGLGPAIDQHDRVVRFNYKDEGVGLDPLHKGERSDCVYFNRSQTEDLITRGDLLRFPRTPDWIISRRQQHVDALKSALEAQVARRAVSPWDHKYRSTPVYGVPMFRGVLTAVPNAVLDLLHHGAGEVNVFHADFMLTAARSQNYNPRMESLSDATRITVRSFAGAHDPVTQLAIMKTAWKSGRVKGDEPFVAALQLSEQAYMDALQKIYGNALLNIALT